MQAKIQEAIEKAFADAGIDLIPQNGGGDGVRFRRPVPRFVQLFRRDDVQHRQWVAFAFDYKDARRIGFVRYEALGLREPVHLDPESEFDRNHDRILICAAQKFDQGHLDPDGRVLIESGDLQQVPYARKGCWVQALLRTAANPFHRRSVGLHIVVEPISLSPVEPS